MRKPQGVTTVTGEVPNDAPTMIDRGIAHAEKEIDTFTCGHCCRVIHVLPRMDPADMGGLCKQCMELICPNCVDKMVCTPWEQQMEEIEARDRFRKAAGLNV